MGASLRDYMALNISKMYAYNYGYALHGSIAGFSGFRALDTR